ncbi:hypothetical protein [Breoghania sp. L-A4]|uniref:magnesium chelatase subunit ChlI family protein n=1 Tax=Breoghania sp. L-A4 TaxID=2304600 RepID=UPI0020C0062A|nr:hypothetical protein [Breoghania sp. L-A4]
MISPGRSEGSLDIAARVAAARALQAERFEPLAVSARTNAQAPARLIEDIAELDADGVRLLRDAADMLHLSARGYHRVLKVARTLADLDGEARVRRPHLAEALSYRGAPTTLAHAA